MNINRRLFALWTLLVFCLALTPLRAQSLKDLIKAVPTESLPFGNNDESIEKLFSIPIGSDLHEADSNVINSEEVNEETLPLEIFPDVPLRVTSRSKEILFAVWNDGTSIQFRRLKARNEYLLAIVRSVSSTESVSTLQIYDARGKEVTRRYALPQMDGRLFATTENTPREQMLLSMLPIKLSFSDGREAVLSIEFSPSGSLTKEQIEELGEQLRPARKEYVWKKAQFVEKRKE